MRKFLLLILLSASLCLSGEDTLLERFQHLYFQGDFQEAHQLLPEAFPDDTTRHIWDERIHAWEEQIPSCELHTSATPGVKGNAFLHIGRFREAQECFDQDWLSRLGAARLALWEGRTSDARESLQKALDLQPENPDLVFLAANLASSREQSLAYFQKYLDLPGLDAYRKNVVQYAIEFMIKTWEIPLNVPGEITGAEEIESDYRKGELSIRGTINGQRRVELLLDTGASGITLKETDWESRITSDVMRVGIGAEQRFRTTQMVLYDFQAAGYQVKNPVVGISPRMRLDQLDGIVGSALFSKYLVLVPLRPGRNVTLIPCDQQDALSCLDNSQDFSEKTTVPFYLVNRLMILKGRIRNSPPNLDMLLDTGAQHSILSAAAARRFTRINIPLSKEAGRRMGPSGVGGQAGESLVAENVELEVGGLKKGFNQMVALNLAGSSNAMDLEMDVILGRDFLQGYTLLIDYRNYRVTFLR